MGFTEEELREHLDDAVEDVQRKADYWRDGKVPLDGVTNVTYSTAGDFANLAKIGALLGAVRQSREWYGEAARFYLERVRASRLRRDVRERSRWESEPRMCSLAINAALLSREEELIAEAATEALAIDESYLDAFADDYPDSPASYYDARTRAALALDDERAGEFHGQLEESLRGLEASDTYRVLLPDYYRGLLDGDEAAVQAGLDDLLAYYDGEHPDPDTPRAFVHDVVSGLVVLARRHGLDVSVDSDRVPDALVREDVPGDDVELDVDVPGVGTTSDVRFFELERGDGAVTIAARIYHPGGEPVSADDVPAHEAGPVLSEAWIEAAIEEARRRNAYDDDLVEEAEAAYEDGSLTRKLVVVQDRTDEHTFDESIAQLPVDDVELLKGAGRRS